MFPACTTLALERCAHAPGTDTWDIDIGSRRSAADAPPETTESHHVGGWIAEETLIQRSHKLLT